MKDKTIAHRVGLFYFLALGLFGIIFSSCSVYDPAARSNFKIPKYVKYNEVEYYNPYISSITCRSFSQPRKIKIKHY